MPKRLSFSSGYFEPLNIKLAPFLWVERVEPDQWTPGAWEVRGIVRLPDGAPALTTNAEARRALFDRAEEMIVMLGDRVVGHPELTIRGESRMTEDDREYFLSIADVRIVVRWRTGGR